VGLAFDLGQNSAAERICRNRRAGAISTAAACGFRRIRLDIDILRGASDDRTRTAPTFQDGSKPLADPSASSPPYMVRCLEARHVPSLFCSVVVEMRLSSFERL